MNTKQKNSINRKAAELYPDYKIKGTHDSYGFVAFIVGAKHGFTVGERFGIKKSLKKYKLNPSDI